jgi:hypothetical protein
MDVPLVAFVVYTASGIVLWLLADIARTNRAIFKKLSAHAEKIAIMEQRCQDTHHRQHTGDLVEL